MIAFLKSPAKRRVRTNNHVERANRKLRYYEKVRYKWRQRRAIVRFILLAIDRWRRDRWDRTDVPEHTKNNASPAVKPKSGKHQKFKAA